ncbi:chloramphenicol phosphotransferase [Devosia limi DSM 17137]|uniref:Chloramphenicol 3-O phosphotransferase n=1 Tax=Devosia limi DSM 17137 TaxID=1121477 RepID=A0A0F5LTP7_9HYPH|nr:chloramphenicol phosphotransferase [Devosia limi]KKB85661.1 chloramphenicol phosphotransferase [Devosia limi DSM 17137]SHF16624.1 chloramphenicol 3-O phosphotransferase [Devosia limi DSM 17137]
MTARPGRIVILNGVPRSGKSSIVAALQQTGPWINLGVDVYAKAMPRQLLPGIGLRPGGERPDLEPMLPVLFAGLYDSIAAHARLGLDVVADLGHHDSYSTPLGILPDCARRLAGLPVLFVGIHCPIEVIMARRNADPQGIYASSSDGSVPEPVRRWQDGVHRPGIYDLDVDTAQLSSEQCAAAILALLDCGVAGFTAFEQLARLQGSNPQS